MNYYNTFILVAPDCPVKEATIPQAKNGKKSIPTIQYDLLSQFPYRYNQEEIIFETYILHKEISEDQIKSEREKIWNYLFKQPQACLRASPLPKKYGWGLHFNTDGKIALVAMESEEYQRFKNNGMNDTKILTAMRNSRE